MKVLQINKYHYKRGGSDAVYLNTTTLLEEQGHEVHHFAMQYIENAPSVDSLYFAPNNDFVQQSFVSKIINSASFFYSRSAAKNLEKLILKTKPDVAHLHIFYGSLTSSILEVLKKHSIPAVVSVHDYKLICPSYLLLDGKNEICERCAGKNFIHCVANTCVKDSKIVSTIFALESYYRDFFHPYGKLISRFIFVSQFSKNIHLRFRPEIKDKSVHLYNFDPALSNRIPVTQKGSYFLYAGRLSREKGVETIIKAFKNLPDLTLKIAGDGPLKEKLIGQISPNVELMGFRKGEELENIISQASFILVPSEWYENNPMAIIEAYSLGKPVIASSIGGIPEIVEHEKTGFLFQAGNQQELGNYLRKANEMGETEYKEFSINARQFAERNFEQNQHYERLKKIYDSVLVKKIQL